MMHPWSVPHRLDPAAAALASAVALLAVAGCGTPGPSDAAPSARSVGEPWQPAPFAVAQELIEAGVDECRLASGVVPDDVPAVVADIRGGNRMLIVFAGAGGQAECMLRVAPGGGLIFDSGGGGTGGAAAPPGPRELQIHTSSTVNTGVPPDQPGGDHGYVTGPLGEAIAAVQIELGTGERLVATTSPAGWFAAWWPGTAELRRAIGFDAAGVPVAETR